MLRLPGAIIWLALLCPPLLAAADDAGLQQARLLLARGRYAEALEAAGKVPDQQSIEVVLLRSQALVATGKSAKAEQHLSRAIDESPQSIPLLRAAALLADRQIDKDKTIAAVRRLLEVNEDDLIGRWLLAKYQIDEGDFAAARESLAGFSKQADAKAESIDEALAQALGLAEHARWARESKWFDKAVNDVLGDAEKRFPAAWQIPALRARLFAEKHNEPSAVDALNAALAKNGLAADLHLLRARFAIERFDLEAARRSLRQARRIDAEHPQIALLEADIAFCELRADRALNVLKTSSPADPQAQGRIAAAEAAMQNKSPAATSDVGDPHPEELIAEGDALDRMRRFPQSAQAYRQALEAAPDFPGIRSKLAHQLLRLAEEKEGLQLLKNASDEDPFDVRVKNTVAVLDVLSGYATLETEHFLIRFDRGQDELLARYAAEYLEKEVHPELAKRFGYAPQGKSLIEIFSRARNTSGHGWFSARMVGVPGLHTIGACAGKVVALASPTDMPRPYNWARVLRHEFVHLVNLEQTSFNVPHWVTEGLAVAAEERPRPGDWTRLLTQRFNDEQLFTLDDINFGFIRPSDSRDWTCAYAQAEIYIEFMAQRYGEECVPRLLAAFAENLPTEQAVEKATGVAVADFEQGYLEYMGKLVEQWGLADSTASQNIERLTSRLAAEPDSASALAELAAAHLASGDLPQARKYATQAARLAPRQPTAAFVLASLALDAKDEARAVRIAQAALDPAVPHEPLLLLLVDLKLASKEDRLAEKLLLLGKKRFPTLEQWNVRLAKLYGRRKDDARLEPILTELAERMEDDASVTSRLAELAAAKSDDAALERWATATLQIDVRHAASHAHLAKLYTARKEPAAAVLEWRAAIAADGKQPEWKLALARLLIEQGEREQAAALLEELVQSAPGLPGLVEAAQELRK